MRKRKIRKGRRKKKGEEEEVEQRVKEDVYILWTPWSFSSTL